eukprot:1389462-Pyramimonas_sp.AAC.1
MDRLALNALYICETFFFLARCHAIEINTVGKTLAPEQFKLSCVSGGTQPSDILEARNLGRQHVDVTRKCLRAAGRKRGVAGR